MAGKNVATKDSGQKIDVSKAVEQLPAHLQGKTEVRGSENVGSSDIIIPRIEIVQAQSKCLKRTDPGYIATAKPGMLYNNVTREVLGSQAIVCPVFFKKEWLLWIDRKAPGASGTGGFRGAYGSEADALRAKRDLGDDGKNILVTETHQQFLIVVNSAGKMEDAVLSASRTKLKVSRNWNSLIRMAGGDRFARLYKLTTAEESNDKGDFWNYAISAFGYAPEAVYRRAEKIYDMAAKGLVEADRTFDDDGNSGEDADSEM